MCKRATLRVSLPSSFQPGQVHAAGTEVRLVQRVRPDEDSRWWAEVRVPEDALEGGAWYETLDVGGDDIEFSSGSGASPK